MDGSGGTLGHTLTAELAFVEIDVGQIVLYCDGAEGAGLLALAAADAGGSAGLAGDTALVLIHAGDIDAAVLGSLVAQLDDALGTCLDAGSAGCAPVLVDLGDKSLWIDPDGTELAGLLTVPAAQTAVPARCVSAVEGVHDTAG